MIHRSTYPNPSPHAQSHTHTQTQTQIIRPSIEPHTHKPSNQLEPTTTTTPTTQAIDQQTQAINQKPMLPIRNPGRRKYPENAITVVRNSVTDQQTPSLPRLRRTLLQPTTS